MHCRKDIRYFYRLMSNISLWMTPLQAKIILRLEKINKVPLRYNVGDVVYTGQINKSVWSWRDMGYYRRSTQYLSQFPKRLSSFFGTGKNINLTMLLAKALDLRHISCCPSNLFLCAEKITWATLLHSLIWGSEDTEICLCCLVMRNVVVFLQTSWKLTAL